MKTRYITIIALCIASALGAQFHPDFHQEQCKPSIGWWENLGQVIDANGNPVDHVKYYSEGAQPSTFLSDSSRVTFALALRDGIPATLDTMLNIRMFSTGEGSRYSTPQGHDQKSHYKNYFLDHTAPNGATFVHGYDWVLYEEFCKDIDLRFYSGSAGSKMTFLCKPGFNPANLILGFQGQESLRVDVDGALRMYRNGHWLRIRQAQAYQVDTLGNIIQLYWNAEYQANDLMGVVTFQFDTYDPDLPVPLQAGPDPMAGGGGSVGLCWGTYFGGDAGERIYGSTTDGDGNYYVVGYSQSAFITFPQTVGIQLVPSGEAVFLTKFHSDHELVWTVYYGSAGDHTVGWGVAAKNPQEIYVTGYTVDNNLYNQPQTGAYNDQSASGFQRKAIIGKFDDNGDCVWSTYFGDAYEGAYGIAIDALDRLIIVGETDGTNLPVQTMGGANSWSYGGGSRDGFIALFGDTDQLLWCTPYGGDGLDVATDERADAHSFVVSGHTTGTVPCKDGGPNAYDQTSNAGGTDLFIVAFNLSAAWTWATHLGGSSDDLPGTNSLAITKNNTIVVVGGTTSTDFPIEPGPGWYDDTNAGQAGFIARFAGASKQMTWGTYVSGAGENFLECVTDDELGNLYVAGYTEDGALPLAEITGVYYQNMLVSDYPLPGVQEGLDALVMVFTPDHWLAHSTYLGGGSGFFGEDICTAEWHDGLLYCGGHTSKQTNPLSAFPLFDPGAPAWYDDLYYYPSTRDGFIVALCTDLLTGLAEHGSNGTLGLVAVETGNGLFTVSGWGSGDHTLTVHDAAGRCI
ncbi:MAG: hypothetical protein JNM31_07595 [Flavobacteriales bacterium]|nr:hypothetical protein [Flavobacteriales bacterium]